MQEYWIVNLQDLCIEVYRGSENGKYQEVKTYQIGATIAPLAQPKHRLEVGSSFVV